MHATDSTHTDSHPDTGAEHALETLGFHLLGEEDTTEKRTSLRVMLEPWSSTMATLQLRKPAGRKETARVELMTRFSDNRFVCTGNTNPAAVNTAPPEIDVLQLPAKASAELIVDAHREMVANYLRRYSEVAPTPLRGLEEFRAARHEMEVLKARHRPRSN
jgi:hypothetical protein